MAVTPTARAEKIQAGAVGGPTATMWLFYVGFDQGFFKKHDVDLDIIFAPTAPGILQQLTAGSLDIVATTGIGRADPRRRQRREEYRDRAHHRPQ